MAESLKSRLVRLRLNLFPAFWCSGAKLIYLSDDFHEMHLKLPLNLRSRNYIGTIFGGSMFSATDPTYFLLLFFHLRKNYIIWDKASSIRFKKPARGALYAKAVVTDEEIEAIRAELKNVDKLDRVYTIDLVDDEGNVCAMIEKTIHIRNKNSVN
jgi:acyl-coenzyme A thioesterase PaaI-like protein